MKDGGPAFPAQHYDLAEGEHGMTLRDYFAAKAMQTEMLSIRKKYNDGDIDVDDWEEAQSFIAAYAYDMADAMLRAR